MVTERKNRTWYDLLLASLFASRKWLRRSPRVHDYTHQQQQSDYVFEPVTGKSQGYMTGQGKGILKGDYILLSLAGKTAKYQVQNIEYYASPADMWIALLLMIELNH